MKWRLFFICYFTRTKKSKKLVRVNIMNTNAKNAKPFLKWAGGKGQLIPAIEKTFPTDLIKKKNLTYIEPFIGSGAVMFWFLNKFPNVKKAVINDINGDLTKAYSVIKNNPKELIDALSALQSQYYKLSPEEKRRNFFLKKREEFNSRHLDDLNSTVLLIFLNRTCFNGLYRVNSSNQFNVPFGKYDKPKICDAATIMADSAILQKVTILNGDYKETLRHATKKTFFYFDPPYKPISKTSSFNSYAKDFFGDDEQRRLKLFCDKLSAKKYRWLLSNSDPKNIDPHDNFFEKLYSGDSIFIDRVKAKRSINSNASKRGEIFELLISNYKK